MTLRVGIVGARRAREGLGPFVARELVRAGAEVAGFTATTDETRDAAAEQLREFAAVAPPGYATLDAMLAEQALDALAICTPHEAHATALERALDARLHTLCDKPFVWGDDFAARTRELVARFAATDRILFENCQWPQSLTAFDALHPGARERPPRRFRMSMEPLAHGIGMLADSLPHPLSLLQALAPAATARAEAIRVEAPAAGHLDLSFTYVADSARIAVEIALRRSDAHPRRTRYEIDGCEAAREVDPADYSLRLRAGERSVAMPDPMAAQVSRFVACASAGHDGDRRTRLDAIVARASLLEALVDAARAAGVR